MIQNLWLKDLNWDDPLSENLFNEWQQFIREIKFLENLKIDRYLPSTKSGRIEWHGFFDASEKAYAASVYWRYVSVDNVVTIKLITAKTKVALTNQISFRVVRCVTFSLIN